MVSIGVQHTLMLQTLYSYSLIQPVYHQTVSVNQGLVFPFAVYIYSYLLLGLRVTLQYIQKSWMLNYIRHTLEALRVTQRGWSVGIIFIKIKVKNEQTSRVSCCSVETYLDDWIVLLLCSCLVCLCDYLHHNLVSVYNSQQAPPFLSSVKLNN